MKIPKLSSSRRAITKMQSIVLIVIVVVAIVASVGAYMYLRPSGPAPTEVTEIRIGANYPLTGPYADITPKIAIPFWYDELINKAGGIQSMGGAKVKIIFGDNQGKTDLALSEQERLISQEHVVLTTGSEWSSQTYVMQEVSARLKVPLLSSMCSSPTLLQRTDIAGKWFFLNQLTDDKFTEKQLRVVVQALEDKGLLGKVHTYAFMYSDGLFETTVKAGYQAAVEKLTAEGKISWTKAADIGWHAPATDLTTEVLQLKAADPDIVMFSTSAASDSVLLVNAMDAQGYYPPVSMANDGGWIQIGFHQTEDAWIKAKYFFNRFPKGFAQDQAEINPYVKAVFDKWATSGAEWDTDTMYFYKEAVIVKAALEIVGNDPTWDRKIATLPEKLAQAFLKVELTSEQTGGMSAVKFNPNTGLNDLEDLLLVQMQDDPKTPGDTQWFTVYPTDVASKQIIIPDPRSRGLP